MKKIAYLQLHRICDQECIFCAQPSNGATLDFEAIQSQIDGYIQDGYTKIIFSGGEPSLSKYFFQTIEYCHSRNIEMTILSNGHRFAEYEFAKKSIESGLQDYHISLHSHIAKIHDKLVEKEGSLYRCFQALSNLLSLGAHITINITINNYNVLYFDRMILSILRLFPGIQGFIINNLETSQIPKKNYHVIAQLKDIKKTIPQALGLIVASKKRVRIERVPICYIRGYEYLSTDLEYIIQKEQKYLHYLGEYRDSMELSEENYVHISKYGKNCSHCDLKGLCAGMEGLHKHYDENDLIPQKVEEDEKEKIIAKFSHVFK